MRLGVLGPLSVLDDAGTAIPVTAGKQRVLLAVLAIRANRIVPVDELVELMWDGAAPPGAARAIRVYVVRLRRALGTEVGARLVTRDPGYLWQAEPDEVDVLRFAHGCDEGGAAARAGAWQRAADLLTEALTLWRGTPLVDVPSQAVRDRELPRLTRLRLQALEDRIDADLHLGRHQEAVTALRDLIADHPLREHLYAQLMLALAGTGNRAEALEVYQAARGTLVDELGIEPGPELRRLHDRVLTGAPAPADTEPEAAVPRMLPPAVTHFTGRADELKELSELLTAEETSGVALVSAIGGTAGVGKTALALSWAHRHADHFPDGQLYVDLRGYDPDQPVPATAALAGFLRALGVPDTAIPADADERAARYRGMVTGRRMLIVADNAGTVGQVRPLLPGTPTCVLVVTSRDALAGLVARDGARRIELDVLPLADAVGLLRALIGERVVRDPTAAAALADRCARLPLALRVAAERAVSWPDAPLADLVRQLADQRRPLDVLDGGGDPHATVRTVLSWSYRHLAAPVAGAFRLISLHPGAEWDIHAAAALTGTDLPRADTLLTELARAHLVQPTGAGRYTMHDLLRAYGRELAADHDDEPTRRTALTAVLDHYAHTAAVAVATLHPAGQDQLPDVPPSPVPGPLAFDTPADALVWLDVERPNLVAVVGHAAGHGWPRHAIRLAAVLRPYLDFAGHHADAVTIHTCAADAARGAGDRAEEATAHTHLGAVALRQGRTGSASDHLVRALSLTRQIDDHLREARVLGALGILDFHLGHYEQAADHVRRSLILFQDSGDRFGVQRTLANLGFLDIQLGHHEQAVHHLRQALALSREIGDTAGTGSILDSLGDVECRLGHHEQASAYYEESLVLGRRVGDRHGEANTLMNLAELHLRLGRFPEADRRCQQALTLLRDIGDPAGEAKALNGSGDVALALGRSRQAVNRHTAALDIADRIGDRAQQARAHHGLGTAHHATGAAELARHHWREALRRYDELGSATAKELRTRLADDA